MFNFANLMSKIVKSLEKFAIIYVFFRCFAYIFVFLNFSFCNYIFCFVYYFENMTYGVFGKSKLICSCLQKIVCIIKINLIFKSLDI